MIHAINHKKKQSVYRTTSRVDYSDGERERIQVFHNVPIQSVSLFFRSCVSSRVACGHSLVCECARQSVERVHCKSGRSEQRLRIDTTDGNDHLCPSSLSFSLSLFSLSLSLFSLSLSLSLSLFLSTVKLYDHL